MGVLTSGQFPYVKWYIVNHIYVKKLAQSKKTSLANRFLTSAVIRNYKHYYKRLLLSSCKSGDFLNNVFSSVEVAVTQHYCDLV